MTRLYGVVHSKEEIIFGSGKISVFPPSEILDDVKSASGRVAIEV